MNYQQITNIYREIGRTYREYGADQVVLLKSQASLENEKELSLEIAVDGAVDIHELQKISRQCWPAVVVELLDLNENPNLITEIVEDGILL